MKSVVVFLSEGFEEIEAVTPIDYLRRAGVNVVTVSVPAQTKVERRENVFSLLDPHAVLASHGVIYIADKSFDEWKSELNGDLPDALFVPGGMPGAKNLSDFQPLNDFIKEMFAKNKLVTAICAAPVVVLSKTGVLNGKKYTCYPDMEKMVSPSCNATHIANVPFVSDGNLITGRGPGAAEQFAMEIVLYLCGEEVAKRVHDSSCQR